MTLYPNMINGVRNEDVVFVVIPHSDKEGFTIYGRHLVFSRGDVWRAKLGVKCYAANSRIRKHGSTSCGYSRIMELDSLSTFTKQILERRGNARRSLN